MIKKKRGGKIGFHSTVLAMIKADQCGDLDNLALMAEYSATAEKFLKKHPKAIKRANEGKPIFIKNYKKKRICIGCNLSSKTGCLASNCIRKKDK